MMPTRSVVRIDGINGVGIIGTAPSSAGSDSTPSSSLSTAAAAGIGSGEGDDVAAGQIISATKSDKNEAAAANDTKKEIAESQVEEGNTNQEVCNTTAEFVSPSTTGQSSAKTPRREDFNSALEYLEAKYVKSIAIEDIATGSGDGHGLDAALKSTTIDVKTKISDSDDPILKDKSSKADQLEERMNGQKSMNDNKAEETISFVDGSDDASFGSGEKLVAKLPVESVVKQSSDESATCNTLPPIAADDAAVSATDESSPSESKNNDGSAPSKGDETLPHLSQPPQQLNQNNEVATNGHMMPHQHPQGYGAWPQFPPQQGWPFPPPPFGMMYPPYPPPFWGMPPFVPHPQAPLQPVQGKDNATQTPNARKNKGESKSECMVKDEVVNTAKSSSSESNSTEVPPLPSLPPIDMTKLGPTNLALDLGQDSLVVDKAKMLDEQELGPNKHALDQDTVDDKANKTLDQDSLVERAKLLVEKEMHAEKASKKGVELERSLPPPALPPIPPVQVATHVPQLPSASAVDQSFSSSSSSKELHVNSDSTQLAATEPTNTTVGIPVLAQHPLPPFAFASIAQVPVLPSIPAAYESSAGRFKEAKMNFDAARLSAFVGKNPQVEGLPGLPHPALPPVMSLLPPASAVDQSSLSSSKKSESNSDSAQVDRAALKKAKKELSDSLVEKAKLLVEQEMLAEKEVKKKAPVEDCPRPATPVPVAQLPPAVDESFTRLLPSGSSSKKRRLDSSQPKSDIKYRKVNAFTF